MLFSAEHEPHFDRVARIVTRPYLNPYSRAKCSTLAGRSALALRRISSISSGERGVCGTYRSERRCRADSIQLTLVSRNDSALRADTDIGKDSLTDPDGRTAMDMRVARRVCDSVTSPNTGWLYLVSAIFSKCVCLSGKYCCGCRVVYMQALFVVFLY